MRSSLWRFNPEATINFNDQSLDCGGPQIQFNLNRGRCGVCGDPYNERKENEMGGRYDSGIIARRYRTGTKVTMLADLVAGNGGGYFEVKLCPRNNPKARVTQACFDKYPLQIKNGKKRRLKVPANSKYTNGLYRMDVKLPKGVTCTHCVIQWHYHASNEWGYDSSGRGCMGCGPQTEIYNCADVTIGYYGDTEGKLGQTGDISVGTLAEVYNTYANGQYGTGVSPLIVNSGINSGWASANDLSTSDTQNENESESDDDQAMMAASLNRQSAGFANLFIGEGGINDNMMSFPEYYNYYDESDYDLNLNMMPLMGGGAGGESGEGGRNFGRVSFNLRSFGGGSSGSSEEGGGGMNFRRSYAMNIPSLSRQYNRANGGGSDSSEEQVSIRRVNNNFRNRQSNLLRLRDALRDISNRQKLRNGLHDIVEKMDRNGNNNDEYYYDNNNIGGGSSSSEERTNRNNVPTYFRDRVGGGGSSSSDCSSEEGGCGGGVAVVDYYPQEPEVVEYYDYTPPAPVPTVPQTEEPEVIEYYDYTTPEPPVPTVPQTEEPEVIEYYDYTTPEPPVPTVPQTEEPIDDYTDPGPDRGDSINDYPNGPGLGGGDGLGGVGGVVDYGSTPGIVDQIGGNDNNYQTQEDIDFIANRQAEFDRWREIEEEERLRRMKERAESWQPPMLPPWPYNNQMSLIPQQSNPYTNPMNIFPQQNDPYSYQTPGLFTQLTNSYNYESASLPYQTTSLFPQQNGPYSMFETGINNVNNGMDPAATTLSRQSAPWQLPDMLSAMNTPSRLSRPFPQMEYASAEVGTRQESSSLDEIFSWMPSTHDVMNVGASKSPIFSQRVANHYLTPFLTLSQSHPALRCQKSDQLVCVATPNYRDIPNADSICTSKCRSGDACGSDYCSCACQKSLMCVHVSSGSVPGGQFGVTELDTWCTDQCNSGQCPNQVCACTALL